MNPRSTPSPASRTVLVLGARGRFGAAAVRAFAAAGWRVVAHQRPGPRPADGAVPPGVVAVDAPLSQTGALAAAAAGASVVVHAVNPRYTAWHAELLPLARQGLEVAERLGALFMLPGNVYNFGAGMPAVLREDTPERPSTGKGRLRCDLEAEMAARASAGRVRSVVIRAGDFFGSGLGSWFDQVVVRSIADGRLTYGGPLDREHAWAYVPDLARAFVAVAEHDEAGVAHRRLHFAGHALTGAELLKGLEAAAASLGIAPPRGWRHSSMPWGVIRVGGLVVPMWREIAEMAYLFSVPHRLDGQALEQAAGPLPQTPLPDALRRALLDLGHGPATQAALAA